MSSEAIQIKRYPNRRYYSRHTSKYVSLKEIEELVQAGKTVEIRDSQTGEELTRTVLTQIILERQPDKMALFPTDLLHFIVRSNDVMSHFLRDYFRYSLTHLDYLQRHGTPATSLAAQPMHWIKAWMESITPQENAADKEQPDGQQEPASEPEASEQPESDELARRVEQLEARLRQLENKD